MYNCIFNGHCTEDQLCNTSCPALAQTSYLLERNGIRMNNPVFRMESDEVARYSDILKAAQGKTGSVIVSGSVYTNQVADALTYCAICENWKGSQLHCTVYNLKYAQYIEEMQKSWSFNSNDSEADYIRIWATNARVLIISNLDFVNFKDFQCQQLLSLVQSRVSIDMTTIIVSPNPSSLVGQGQFFAQLTERITKQKVGDIR